jgi:phosphotransacetylase/acyl dehydratase
MTGLRRNRTFDEIAVGDAAEASRKLTADDLVVFAHASGNLNPIHMLGAGNDTAAGEQEVVAPSAWVGALISCVLGMELPGPGTLYRAQTLVFHGRVHLGDVVTVKVCVLARGEGRMVRLATSVAQADGTLVADGEAIVIAPAERRFSSATALPDIVVERHDHFNRLLAAARTLPALATAVVCPGDGKALKGALLAAEAGLIVPVLVGPRAATLAAAREIGADLGAIEIVDAEDDQDAAHRAVDLVREGKAATLMKGHLHTDVFLSAVVRKEGGLRAKMAERGQILGGIVDGPLAMDNAIDLDAANGKGIHSLVAGHADVLVVPNLEAGNMLAKELTFIAHAEAAGIVMGARVPLILNSRADGERSRLASAAIALLVENWQRTGVGVPPLAVAAE